MPPHRRTAVFVSAVNADPSALLGVRASRLPRPQPPSSHTVSGSTRTGEWCASRPGASMQCRSERGTGCARQMSRAALPVVPARAGAAGGGLGGLKPKRWRRPGEGRRRHHESVEIVIVATASIAKLAIDPGEILRNLV